MARIRTIKPEFFKHERLAELSPLHRILFIGLWTLADREGRLEDRPKRIKVEVLPYDEADVDAMLADLDDAGFVIRYSVDGLACIAIPSFIEHQRVSGAELQQPLKTPPFNDLAKRKHSRSTRDALETHSGSTREDRKGVRSTECGVQEGNGVTEGRPRAVVPFDGDYGAWPAQRQSPGHAWRSTIGKHIPHFLHADFVESLANAGDATPDATLREWYAGVESSWRGQKIGDDALRFWRKRFEEWQGVTESVVKRSGGFDPDVDYTPSKYRNGGAA